MFNVEILFTLGKSVKTWNRRWFVLKPNGFLYYYTGPDLKTEKGRIDMINSSKVAMYNEVSTAEKLSSADQSIRTFCIVTTDRTYTCVCPTSEECRFVMQHVDRLGHF